MEDDSASCAPEFAYLVRMVLREQTPPEHAATALGINAEDRRIFLSASRQLRLPDIGTRH